MSHKITYQIPEQRFEQIRDKIGEILTLELAQQTPAEDVVVWRERFIQFDRSELPAANVAFNQFPFEGQDPTAQEGEAEFYIDIHTDAKHTSNQKGDTAAALNANRISGIIRYILMSPFYRKLNMPTGVVKHRQVSMIETGKINENDTTHTIVNRITFRVRVAELVSEAPPTDGQEYTTQVKIGETDKGHYFVYETE